MFPVPGRAERSTNEQLEAVATEWGPRMAKPHIVGAGEWYRRVKHQMAHPDASPNAAPSGRSVTPVTSTNSDDPFGPDTAADAADAGEVDEESARREMAEMASELRAEGAIPAPPAGDVDYAAIDPSRPIAAPATDPDELSWRLKDGAPTPEAAAEAFDRALRELSTDQQLQRPDGSVVFTMTQLLDCYQFRSRPWFVERLRDAAEGKLTVPPGLALERVDKGTYRVVQLATAGSAP
jgi:hypothetical protein